VDPHDLNADPDPTFHFNPDPAFHFKSGSGSSFSLYRIQLFTLIPIRIQLFTLPDPAFPFYPDPDPVFPFYPDPDPAFPFDADPVLDSAPHQGGANLRPLSYRPFRAPF
jgi:hypothetical protein